MMWRKISIILVTVIIAGCIEKTPIYPNGSNGNGNGNGEEPGEPNTPGTPEEPYPGESVSIAYIKTLYRGYPQIITEGLSIRGVVTANDRFSNYLRTIVIEDATGGIEVKIGDDLLFTRYPIGRNVEIRCQGLTLGNYGGIVSLGTASSDPAYENSFIHQLQESLYIVVLNQEAQRPKPRELTLSSIEKGDVGRLVCFRNVQFVDEEMDLAWCDDNPDQSGTDRHITDREGNILTVRTNSSALFAGNILPRRSGYIEGILSIFAGNYQLRVVYESYVIMEGERF